MRAVLVSAVVLAHSWYPHSCCAENHCRPVPCDELVEQQDGSWRWGEYKFARSMVAPSQDKMCHVCVIGQAGKCAFVLQGA